MPTTGGKCRLLLVQDSGGVLAAMTLLLLPGRHTSAGADFSPLLLQLGLARHTCGAVWDEGGRIVRLSIRQMYDKTLNNKKSKKTLH